MIMVRAKNTICSLSCVSATPAVIARSMSGKLSTSPAGVCLRKAIDHSPKLRSLVCLFRKRATAMWRLSDRILS